MNNIVSRLYFASDYMEGAHPAIMQKLVETNLEKTVGYYGVLSAQPVADFITAVVAIVLVRTSVYKEIRE